MTSPRSNAFDTVRNMPRYFWLLSVVFTLTAGVLLLDHFRTYSSEVTILVVHKNEKTAASADQVVDNIAELPRMLAFYDQLLERFPEIHDPWVGMGDDVRKALWLERVSVERIDYSGLIRLRISADTATDATLLAQKSAANLFRTVGQYYDIRTEIDIRTVDEPVTRAEISRPAGWLLSSLSVGFIFSAIVSSVMAMFSKHSARVPEALRSKFVPTWRGRKDAVDESADEFVAPRKQRHTMPLQPVTFEGSLSPDASDTDTKTPEPDEHGLPFLEDGVSLEEHLFGAQIASSADEDTEVVTDIKTESGEEAADGKTPAPAEPPVSEEIKKQVTTTAEPTSEELKRRLNQLLNGEL